MTHAQLTTLKRDHRRLRVDFRLLLVAYERALGEISEELRAAGAEEVVQHPMLRSKQHVVDSGRRRIARLRGKWGRR